MIANQNTIYLNNVYYSLKRTNENTLENINRSIWLYTSSLEYDEDTTIIVLDTFSIISGEVSSYFIINPSRYYKRYTYIKPKYMYLKRSAIIKKAILNWFQSFRTNR